MFYTRKLVYSRAGHFKTLGVVAMLPGTIKAIYTVYPQCLSNCLPIQYVLTVLYVYLFQPAVYIPALPTTFCLIYIFYLTFSWSST